MQVQDLVKKRMEQIGKGQVHFEKLHQDTFDIFSIKCKFRKMHKYSEHPICKDKKDTFDWGCGLNWCPYIREVKGEQTGRE